MPSSSDLDSIEEAKTIWLADMPFCGRWIASYFSPCVPSTPTKEWAAADENFPGGRLSISDGQEDVVSIRNKDKWVETTVNKAIASRIEQEKQQGKSHYRYFRNDDCQEAYAKYTCWLNFPRCDDFDESLPLCQSVCENLFRVCGFESDIWRCEADIVDGDNEYDLRTFFPGQPFTRNEFYPKSKEPVAVCTPSIKGGASSRLNLAFGFMFWFLMSVAFLCADILNLRILFTLSMQCSIEHS